ncbi:DMT family transporter [Bacillus sp. T33-2]|uniref:DMT family transporter n=1 Tax=Bacillus sp. T33-2 TaxID=2054168 RepID=UPI000C75A3E7|nr:DMT family transporter [Bacillus sp. T33-2]PLR96936.1 EamA family transporter [Bacillus sp. T33-2]
MNNLRIYLILTVAMMFWGLNVAVIKLLVEHFSPVMITSLRIFVAGIVVFIILAGLKSVRKPNLKETFYILSGGLLNIAGHHYFLAIGLLKTSAVNGGLILGLGPLLTASMAILFLGKRLTIIRALGFIFGGIGVSLTVLAGGSRVTGINTGDLFVFISILSQAASFIIISKAAKTLEPRLLTGYMLLIGSAALFAASLLTEPYGIKSLANDSVLLWVAFFASSILATAFGQMIYNYAIGKAGPAETSIFLNLNTFFSLIGAAVFLGEKITAFHLFGLLFIITGVIFGSGALEELMLKKRPSTKAA